jgi:site-specific DNA-adenine methylase
MKKKYGIPYMGSKSKILPHIAKLFPNAENFYDLFGGGFSATHFMVETRGNDFKYFHFNEIRSGVVDLIKDAIAGKYNYKVFKPEFINRERFFKEKDTNAYVKMCWSFGNDGRSYLFGKDIEKYKESLHNAIIFNKFDKTAKDVLGIDEFREGYSVKQKRFFLRSRVATALHNKGKSRGELEQLQQLQQLQQLERLERQIFFYSGDYRSIEIKSNSVIYCDPPYIGTTKYDNEFNYKEFYEWANAQTVPVFISEYTLDDDRFKVVFSIKKRSLMSASEDKRLIKEEKVFANKTAIRALLIKE